MPMFQVKFRTERPERKRELTAAQKKLSCKARKALGLTAKIDAQVGLAKLRNVELPGIDPETEARQAAALLSPDFVVLSVDRIDE